MRELRSSRARRNRAAVNPNRSPQPDNNNNNNNNKRLTVRSRQQRRKKGNITIVDAADDNNNIVNVEEATTPFKEKQDIRFLREEVAVKKMDEYDSGGRSADKGAGAEDEGSTAPLPEKVNFSFFLSFEPFSIFFLRKMLKKGERKRELKNWVNVQCYLIFNFFFVS